MSLAPAPFVWHDLITTDVEGAKAFYAKVIGWDMQCFSPDNAYTVLSAGGQGIGGIMAIPENAKKRGAPPCWQGYVFVDDVDACANRIKATGGAVLEAPQDIPNVGRFALVADPQGAVFIIFKPNSKEMMPQAPAHTQGLVGWNELHAGDGEKAFDWYASLFGWTLDRSMDMGAMGQYRIFATGGPAVGGIMTKMPDAPYPFWAYYFQVDALDAAIERTQQAGGKLMFGPQEVPGPMYIANCQDPQGAWFSMVAPQR